MSVTWVKRLPFLVAAVCFRSELNYCVQWDFDVWKICLREVMKVCISADFISLSKIHKPLQLTSTGESPVGSYISCQCSRTRTASHTCLVSNYKNILLALELHNDGLKSHYDVTIRFPTAITVVELIVIPVCKIIRVGLL